VLWADFPLTSSASLSKESTYTQTILHYEETAAVTSTQFASMKYSVITGTAFNYVLQTKNG
jgi:hypothetical protein